MFFDNSSGDEINVVFRDMLTLALAGILVILMILLPHINPPKKENSEDIKTPGNLIVELIWDKNINVDLDLWVAGPSGGPVGFSNQNGKLFNLLRDDLGNFNDITELNYENSFSRGIPDGKYSVNVHWYTNSAKVEQVNARIVVSIKKNETRTTTKKVLTREITLTDVGREVTIFNFMIEDGELIPETVNSEPVRMVSNISSGP